MNRSSKNFVRILAIGALLGAFVTSWIAPKAISWYFDPPAGFGISCKEPIDWALHKLQIAQLWGLALGAFAGIGLYFAVFKKREEALPPSNPNHY